MYTLYEVYDKIVNAQVDLFADEMSAYHAVQDGVKGGEYGKGELEIHPLSVPEYYFCEGEFFDDLPTLREVCSMTAPVFHYTTVEREAARKGNILVDNFPPQYWQCEGVLYSDFPLLQASHAPQANVLHHALVIQIAGPSASLGSGSEEDPLKYPPGRNYLRYLIRKMAHDGEDIDSSDPLISGDGPDAVFIQGRTVFIPPLRELNFGKLTTTSA